MDFESVVMYYLAAEGLFLSPQFSVKDSSGGEWSCPDFVALDFSKREVQVVEVTTAATVSGIVEKLEKREDQWFRHLRPQLARRGVVDESWKYLVRVFVRESNVEMIRQKLSDAEDVVVEPIEKIAFSWKWPWGKFPAA
jgi:hypothetical protein